MKKNIYNFVIVTFLLTSLMILNSCSLEQDEFVAPPVDNSCVTTNMSYSGFIKPLIDDKCIICHAKGSAYGSLASYDDTKVYALNGKLYSKSEGSMNGYLPQDSTLGCILAKIKAWVDQGAQNN